MPEITRFYGIVIKMYFRESEHEHEPSHIHAIYGDYLGEFNIKNGKMLVGDLPKKAQSLIREWLELHGEELQKMWDSKEIQKLPPLE